MDANSKVVDWGGIGIHTEVDDRHFVGCVVEGINFDVEHVVDVMGHIAGLVVDSAGEYC